MSVSNEFMCSNGLMFVMYICLLLLLGVKKNIDVILSAIAALEDRMLVYLSGRNQFQHFAMSVRNEFMCSNRLMFVIFLFWNSSSRSQNVDPLSVRNKFHHLAIVHTKVNNCSIA